MRSSAIFRWFTWCHEPAWPGLPTPGSVLCSAVEPGAGQSRAAAASAFLVDDFGVIRRCDEHFSLSLDGEMWRNVLGLLPQQVLWREPRVSFCTGLSEPTPRERPRRQGKPRTVSVAMTSDPVTISSASSEWHRASQCHGPSVGLPCVYPSPTSIIYHLSSLCHLSKMLRTVSITQEIYVICILCTRYRLYIVFPQN